jgi:hypothetical protein
VDTIYTRKTFDGKGTSYVFSSAEAEVFVTDARTIDEIRYPSPRPSSSRGEEKGEWDA